MNADRLGIAAAGNWVIDHVKVVDVYPQQDNLANILSVSHGNGGAPYNVLKDLARLGSGFPLEGIGLLGADPDGDSIIADCGRCAIGTAQLARTPDAPTSFTDVMTVRATGRRTFFHHRGANALFDLPQIDPERIRARIFHLGYLLLLDRLDLPSATHGTRAAELLATLSARGIKTSIDVVSEDSGRFATVVTPALRHTDFCILNELEAERTTGIPTRSEGRIDRAAVATAAARLLEHGVRAWVVVHFPEGGYALSADGTAHFQPSVNLPADQIDGTAGAGDAFCAGVLHGLHEGAAMSDALRLAVCTAAASLRDVTCSEGIGSIHDVLQLGETFGFQPGNP